MHNGVRVVAGGYYGSWMEQIIRDLRGHHEPQEEVAFDAVVERIVRDTPEPVVIELGAFWAYYSLWLLQRAPKGRAILVEPDPNNLAVGRANFALNDRVGEFLQAAVAGAPAQPAPFLCESDGVERDIPTESLRSIVDRFEIAKIDVLVADVQGAELPLLEGAAELLPSLCRFVVVSTHHHSISGDRRTHERCLDLLQGLGAHIVAAHTVAESFSGDGLIVASFDSRDRDLVVELSRSNDGLSIFPSEPPSAAELPFPPRQMRELVGLADEASFDNPSGEPVFADLANAGRIFDFGCGCGRVARKLIQQRTPPSRYLGVDVHLGMIRWCQANLSPLAPQFEFVHHDVENPGLNPGPDKPSVLPLPGDDASFDLVHAWSVFTHLRESQVPHYLRECRRLLAKGGVIRSTWFLFDKELFPMMQTFQNALYINEYDVTNATIFDRQWLMLLLGRLDLEIVDITPPAVRGFQWIVDLAAAGERPAVEIPVDDAPLGSCPPPVLDVPMWRVGRDGED
jgi:FkbM family methyltransferase